VINHNTKICNKHFIPEDFVCGGGDPLAPRHLLKKIAIPSVFPWQGARFQRMTTTLQLALGEKQRNEHYVQDHEDITALNVSDSVEFDNADTDCLDVASNSAEIERSLLLVQQNQGEV